MMNQSISLFMFLLTMKDKNEATQIELRVQELEEERVA
jgi:uncharacterized membrane protein YsdA (DUF1294 family)